MPTATDLVTDLPADFEVFGQAVATSMADLLGGTSGQILAKNSNTDMDFVWIANDQGDITGVTATSPLTGGGTSGAITVGIQASSTTQSGAVQLSDSTSTTSSVLAATPTAVKSAYDLADAAIAKSIVDAKGDLIGATAADTPARLAVGTNGQVLKANSAAATGLEWGNPTAIGCSLYRTADQSISNSTATMISWDVELYDTNAFHDNTTNPTRMTIPAGLGGKYLISVLIPYTANATGERVGYVHKNGTLFYLTSRGNLSGSVGTFVNYSYIIDLAASDYIEIQTFQSSGGALSVLGAVTYYANVQLAYLGA